jgi:hypothetical protein
MSGYTVCMDEQFYRSLPWIRCEGDICWVRVTPDRYGRQGRRPPSPASHDGVSRPPLHSATSVCEDPPRLPPSPRGGGLRPAPPRRSPIRPAAPRGCLRLGRALEVGAIERSAFSW